MLQKLRYIALEHQGLTKVRPFGRGLAATQNALEHLGYIQIDSLAVVERAHHHTLWSRIPDYQPEYLRNLIQTRSVFEYWFHAAAFLPMRDFRFVLHQKLAVKREEAAYCPKADPKHMRLVRERIQLEGPLTSRDFESMKKGNSNWWNWKPTKRALERLFLQGDLMVTDRIGMEKVYDLTERVVPSGIDTREPSLHEFCEYLVNVSIRAHGFTTLKQLLHQRSGVKLRETMNRVLADRVDRGELLEYSYDALPTLYISHKALNINVKKPAAKVYFLSPFDNAIIHRDRMGYLFGFDYRLECYLPKEKRRFGYFCLPILFRDEFVGMLDCKVHRKDGVLEIIHLYLNDKQLNWDLFLSHFIKTVNRFAQFNACKAIKLTHATPKKFACIIRQALNNKA